MKYKTVFFDLDHTLWDFEKNSKITLQELYDSHFLESKGVTSFSTFYETFVFVNGDLWDQYDKGLITSEVIRAERFKRILANFEVENAALVEVLSYEYLFSCPRKSHLLPDAVETLDYLKGRYSLSVITNGFDEIQQIKLSSSNLSHYFDHIVTSQKAGYKKPAREIFDYALELHLHKAHEAIMIGDNLLTDIAGAKNAAIDTVFFNPTKLEHQEEITHEVTVLSELARIL